MNFIANYTYWRLSLNLSNLTKAVEIPEIFPLPSCLDGFFALVGLILVFSKLLLTHDYPLAFACSDCGLLTTQWPYQSLLCVSL